MGGEQLSDSQRDELISAARATVGDELRSVTHFTEDAVEQLYLRSDLEKGADLVGFADNERFGFHSQQRYEETELGEYQFMIRIFEHGYLTRVIVGEQGVWVTTDEMAISRFEELGTALAATLREI